jgi:hypothetical protein
MRTPTLSIIILSMFVGLDASGRTFAQQSPIVYEADDVLPNVSIDGESAIIHTQGLYVTDKHYLVTGRRETDPNRALLLRFSRADLRSYEFLDITTPPVNGVILDHPGL